MFGKFGRRLPNEGSTRRTVVAAATGTSSAGTAYARYGVVGNYKAISEYR